MPLIPDRTARNSRPLFGQSDRNPPQSDPADEPQPPTLDPTVIAAPLGNPPEDPFASSGRPLRILRKTPSQHPPEEPFATSFEDTLPGTLRGQPLENPPEDPFASSGRPLRTLLQRLLRNPFQRPSRRSPRKPLRQPPPSTPAPFLDPFGAR